MTTVYPEGLKKKIVRPMKWQNCCHVKLNILGSIFAIYCIIIKINFVNQPIPVTKLI